MKKKTFYRWIDEQELADLRTVGRLRAGPGSMEGKYLTDSIAHAAIWGSKFPGSGVIVRVTVSREVADGIWYAGDNLDGIGPAWFATIEELQDAVVEEVEDDE